MVSPTCGATWNAQVYKYTYFVHTVIPMDTKEEIQDRALSLHKNWNLQNGVDEYVNMCITIAWRGLLRRQQQIRTKTQRGISTSMKKRKSAEIKEGKKKGRRMLQLWEQA